MECVERVLAVTGGEEARKGSEWWCEELKVAIVEKKYSFEV